MRLFPFFIIGIFFFGESCASKKAMPSNNITYEEVDGQIAVEAEHFFAQEKTDIRQWYLTTPNNTPTFDGDPDDNHSATASNQAYLEILPDTRRTHDDKLIRGENFSNEPGLMGILHYRVYFNNPGKYFVWVRTHTSGTEDNGIHVGLNGQWPDSGQRMQFDSNKKTWSWESRQRTEEVHTGVERLIFLEIPSKGEHIISFSMREDGFEFDKWMMTKNYIQPEGLGLQELVKK